jgi:hypothetical protein
MAKKRVFFDECCGDDDLKTCFPVKSHVYVAADFGVRGKEDTTVIDRAIDRRCLIVTVNKDPLLITTATTPAARGRMVRSSSASYS